MSALPANRWFFGALLLLAVSVCSWSLAQAAPAEADSRTWLPDDSITIVVTDSGLGGLSVVADAVRKLQEYRGFGEVELVFYNALFTDEGGYNSLSTREQKVRIFSDALQEFQDRSSPDILLIACNTLSVLFPDTRFASTTKTHVFGIVEEGIDLIAARLPSGAPGQVIIFATETTIDEGAHKDALVDRGIPPRNIVVQKCPQLASYIEQGFDSMETGLLIEAYVDEALGSIDRNGGPLLVSLNCTHYGYSLAAWQAAFAARNVPVEVFLDPNRSMIDFLLPEPRHGRHENVTVNVRVISMIEIPEDRIRSIGRYLHNISPETEAALRAYELVPDLFSWQATGK
jgi:glutamate racemase